MAGYCGVVSFFRSYFGPGLDGTDGNALSLLSDVVGFCRENEHTVHPQIGTTFGAHFNTLLATGVLVTHPPGDEGPVLTVGTIEDMYAWILRPRYLSGVVPMWMNFDMLGFAFSSFFDVILVVYGRYSRQLIQFYDPLLVTPQTQLVRVLFADNHFSATDEVEEVEEVVPVVGPSSPTPLLDEIADSPSPSPPPPLPLAAPAQAPSLCDPVAGKAPPGSACWNAKTCGNKSNAHWLCAKCHTPFCDSENGGNENRCTNDPFESDELVRGEGNYICKFCGDIELALLKEAESGGDVSEPAKTEAAARDARQLAKFAPPLPPAPLSSCFPHTHPRTHLCRWGALTAHRAS
jgi:hypothetical protein